MAKKFEGSSGPSFEKRRQEQREMARSATPQDSGLSKRVNSQEYNQKFTTGSPSVGNNAPMGGSTPTGNSYNTPTSQPQPGGRGSAYQGGSFGTEKFGVESDRVQSYKIGSSQFQPGKFDVRHAGDGTSSKVSSAVPSPIQQRYAGNQNQAANVGNTNDGNWNQGLTQPLGGGSLPQIPEGGLGTPGQLGTPKNPNDQQLSTQQIIKRATDLGRWNRMQGVNMDSLKQAVYDTATHPLNETDEGAAKRKVEQKVHELGLDAVAAMGSKVNLESSLRDHFTITSRGNTRDMQDLFQRQGAKYMIHGDAVAMFENNSRLMRNYLEGKGINASALRSSDISRALNNGMLGTIKVDPEMRKVLTEYSFYLRNENTARHAKSASITNTIKNDIEGFYSDTDVGRGANAVRIAGKTAAAATKAGKMVTGVAINTTIKGAETITKGGAKGGSLIAKKIGQNALNAGDITNGAKWMMASSNLTTISDRVSLISGSAQSKISFLSKNSIIKEGAKGGLNVAKKGATNLAKGTGNMLTKGVSLAMDSLMGTTKANAAKGTMAAAGRVLGSIFGKGLAIKRGAGLVVKNVVGIPFKFINGITGLVRILALSMGGILLASFVAVVPVTVLACFTSRFMAWGNVTDMSAEEYEDSLEAAGNNQTQVQETVNQIYKIQMAYIKNEHKYEEGSEEAAYPIPIEWAGLKDLADPGADLPDYLFPNKKIVFKSGSRTNGYNLTHYWGPKLTLATNSNVAIKGHFTDYYYDEYGELKTRTSTMTLLGYLGGVKASDGTLGHYVVDSDGDFSIDVQEGSAGYQARKDRINNNVTMAIDYKGASHSHCKLREHSGAYGTSYTIEEPETYPSTDPEHSHVFTPDRDLINPSSTYMVPWQDFKQYESYQESSGGAPIEYNNKVFYKGLITMNACALRNEDTAYGVYLGYTRKNFEQVMAEADIKMKTTFYSKTTSSETGGIHWTYTDPLDPSGEVQDVYAFLPSDPSKYLIEWEPRIHIGITFQKVGLQDMMLLDEFDQEGSTDPYYKRSYSTWLHDLAMRFEPRDPAFNGRYQESTAERNYSQWRGWRWDHADDEPGFVTHPLSFYKKGFYEILSQQPDYEEMGEWAEDYYELSDQDWKEIYPGLSLPEMDYPDDLDALELGADDLDPELASLARDFHTDEELADIIEQMRTENPAIDDARATFIQTAMSYIGKIYYSYGAGHGNIDPSTTPAGLDCSGFVSFALYKGGVDATYNPRSCSGMLNSYPRSAFNGNFSSLKPGTILIKNSSAGTSSGSSNHVVIYAGVINGTPMTVECTTWGKKSGVQMIPASKRSSYQWALNPFG